MQTETGRLIGPILNFRSCRTPEFFLRLIARIIGRFRTEISNPLFDNASRVSRDDAPRRHVFHHDGPRSDDRSFGECHLGPNKRIRANPNLVRDVNRRFEQRHGRIAIIVRTCAEMGSLRDGDFVAYCDLAQVIYEGPFANRRPISDRQVPRKVNSRARVNMNVPSNPRAKRSQPRRSETQKEGEESDQTPVAHAPGHAISQTLSPNSS